MVWTDIAFDCTPSPDRLRQAWANVFGVEQDAVSVIDDIAENDPWSDRRVRIALERFHRPGEFPLQIMVLLRTPDLEARVADPARARSVIGELCAELGCRALTASDSANPYEWTLHTPDGATTLIHVDAEQLDDAGAFVLSRQPAAAG